MKKQLQTSYSILYDKQVDLSLPREGYINALRWCYTTICPVSPYGLVRHLHTILRYRADITAHAPPQQRVCHYWCLYTVAHGIHGAIFVIPKNEKQKTPADWCLCDCGREIGVYASVSGVSDCEASVDVVVCCFFVMSLCRSSWPAGVFLRVSSIVPSCVPPVPEKRSRIESTPPLTLPSPWPFAITLRSPVWSALAFSTPTTSPALMPSTHRRYSM